MGYKKDQKEGLGTSLWRPLLDWILWIQIFKGHHGAISGVQVRRLSWLITCGQMLGIHTCLLNLTVMQKGGHYKLHMTDRKTCARPSFNLLQISISSSWIHESMMGIFPMRTFRFLFIEVTQSTPWGVLWGEILAREPLWMLGSSQMRNA